MEEEEEEEADEEVLRRRSIFQEDLDSPSDSSLLLLRRRSLSKRRHSSLTGFWSNTGVSDMISLICRRVNLIINNLETSIASPQEKPYLKNLLGGGIPITGVSDMTDGWF